MIVEKIKKDPGLTFKQLTADPAIRQAYAYRELSKELKRLEESRVIYSYRNHANLKRYFIWNSEFECLKCHRKMPAVKPHVDKTELCRACGTKHHAVVENEVNAMMSRLTKIKLSSLGTDDLRGNYCP